MKEKFLKYCAKVLDGGYIIDSNNSEQVNEIISIITEGVVGCLLIGDTGRGKSFTLEALQKIVDADKSFIKVKCTDIVRDFNKNGHEVIEKWTYSNKNVLYDDLGMEDVGNWFGASSDIMKDIIELRHNAFYSPYKRRITHFTSNLSLVDIEKRYSSRCFSRLCEITDIVAFGEDIPDRRKLRNFKCW